MSVLPFRISVFDKAFNPQDWVGAPDELECTVRLNAASDLSFTVADDDDQVGVLTEQGSRVVVEYAHDPDDPLSPMHLVSGLVAERSGDSAPGTRTFAVLDDWAYVMGLLGVPNPAGSITQQGDEDAYYTVTGPAETVVKTHVAAAAGFWGVPVTVAPDLGRGASISVAVRMHPLMDRLFPAVTLAGLRVTVQQSGAGLVVDVVEPETLTTPLTEASGVVQSGRFTTQPPTITQVIAGGGGEGIARVFVQEIDAAAETAWGIVRPAFLDARDTTDTGVLTARAQERLAEGAATAGVSAALAETDDFRFGVTVNVGDTAEIHLVGAPPITDRVTEAHLSWTADDGLTVTPHVGEVATTFADLVTAAVQQVAAKTRDQDARS